MNNSPFIAWPPTDAPLIDKDNTISDEWKNHLNSITQNLGFIVAHDRFNDTKEETPVNTVISMTTDRRDQLQNARDGTLHYNPTTMQIEFRQNGAWVTFTPVPA